MGESKAEEDSSSLATMEDIQKRLVRPHSLNSQPSSSSIASQRCNWIISQNSSKFDVNSHEVQKKNIEVKKIKVLEDYLDPVLLSTIRARICRKRKTYGARIKNTTKSELSDFDQFEWPGDHHELNALTESSRRTEASRGKPEERNHVVDLNIDYDSFGFGADPDEQSYRSPFNSFEKNSLKRFKH